MSSYSKRRRKPEQPTSARLLALHVLDKWERGDGFADELLHQALKGTHLEERDRHFVQELAYGVLRSLSRLDFIIDALATGSVDSTTRNVLRLGVFQLMETRVPQHAAVNETVTLAGRAKGLVNAILRRFLREREILQEHLATQPLSIRESHPDFLVQRWERRLGVEATLSLLAWDNSAPPLTLRINRLAGAAAEALAAVPGVQSHSQHERFPGMLLADHLDPAWIADGLCYVQDASTLEACLLLNPQPGERVLDACAAPGGKSAFLAQLMLNSGDLVAADSNPERLRKLGGNLGRLHVTNTRFTLIDWLRTDTASPAALSLLREKPFDAILADVPCSNTGVLRRRVDARWRLEPADFQRMPRIQSTIVDSLVPLLAPGGRLVYSTCSIEQEENEHVVASLLDRHPGLTLVESCALRPWIDHVDGAYCALFRKQS